METFSALLAICAGNSPVTGEFPAQRPVTQRFDVFFFIYAWVKGWVNNQEAGDLRRHRAHYAVTMMVNLTNKAMPSITVGICHEACCESSVRTESKRQA